MILDFCSNAQLEPRVAGFHEDSPLLRGKRNLKKKEDDVVFAFPPDDFQLASFNSIGDLKRALKGINSELRANYSFTSNSKYVGVKCKIPKC